MLPVRSLEARAPIESEPVPVLVSGLVPACWKVMVFQLLAAVEKVSSLSAPKEAKRPAPLTAGEVNGVLLTNQEEPTWMAMRTLWEAETLPMSKVNLPTFETAMGPASLVHARAGLVEPLTRFALMKKKPVEVWPAALMVALVVGPALKLAKFVTRPVWLEMPATLSKPLLV